MPARMLPILAQFDIAPEACGCVMAAHLVDQHINLAGKAWGWNRTYRQLFGQVQAAVDRGLAGLDPSAAGSFSPPRFWSRGGDVAAFRGLRSRLGSG